MNKSNIDCNIKLINDLWKRHIKNNIRYLGRPSQNGPSFALYDWCYFLQDYGNILIEMEFLAKKKKPVSNELKHLLFQMNYSLFERGIFGRDEGGGSLIKRNLQDSHSYMNQLWAVLKSIPLSDDWFFELNKHVHSLLLNMSVFFEKQKPIKGCH
jgi:hypothetical protein